MMMTILVPSEYAWIIPIVVPFIIGLMAGAIAKRVLKLAIAIIALILILGAIGYIQLPSLQSIMKQSSEYLPKLQSHAGPLTNILPYSSVTFITGFVLGLWKG